METYTCIGCYFSTQCGSAKRCDYYTPLDADGDDKALVSLIEEWKEEFKAVWEIYANEYNG